ncbi:hypothetical protein [Phyllobacterium endophyticum]|uniref:hypothetical protein n=1 Tax=Phyllobacterium endophyticum TaxID=1149773 RepID=UPI0011B27404|nr:hypothetical protein [Phyllobacterium endophyticum]MBB3236566.1 hypothetical protein [Phyllobacterium endophyticum]TYR39565.1 hypothetical protein FY050_21040 [Phyllobacterium endophyticum]
MLPDARKIPAQVEIFVPIPGVLNPIPLFCCGKPSSSFPTRSNSASSRTKTGSDPEKTSQPIFEQWFRTGTP